MSKVAVFAAALCLLAGFALADVVGSTCDNPQELEMDVLVMGETTYALSSPVHCQSYRYTPRGIWYTYTGEGKTVILDTCDPRTSFDSVIFVFDSCNQADGYISSCVAMDDDGCNQRQSRVMFNAEEGKKYYIFVAGFMNTTGIFYLYTSEVYPPENSKCESAHEIERVPFSIEGETGTASQSFDNCTHTRSGGLWYKFKGDGYPYVAHTCNIHTNYDTVISVFKDCIFDDPNRPWFHGGGQCVASNNDGCYRSSLVSWRSEYEQDYYIFVNGYRDARGSFTLALEQRAMNPYSFCTDPIVITSVPFYRTGKTDYLNGTFSDCRNVDNVHSMFFRIQGMNRKLVVTTCTSSSTVNDSVIDVYTECESNTENEHYGSGRHCVAYNDDYCGLGAQVVFYAGSGSYFIAVSAASSGIDGVSFSLAVMPYDDTQNDQCWYARDIENFPDTLTGNTTNLGTSTQTCEGTRVPRRGGWYRYSHTGPEKAITISTCNEFNQLPARIEVYNDCNEMACVQKKGPDADKGCTTLQFSAKNGRTYNIFITADGNNPGGYFHADFYEESPNEHSTCEDPWFVNRGSLPFRLEDNTMIANSSFSSCQNMSMKGVWVSVIGTGGKLVASTCDSHTGYDTVLELYDGCPTDSNRNREHCMMVNDDNPSCGRSSEIEWQSTSGKYYWLFVTGFAGSSGIFVLNIYEKNSKINAFCNTAKGINSLPYYDYGLTTYSRQCNASCKKHVRKGNWYEIVGNNHWITVSTCHEETDFATEVEIYLGCNGNNGEICVNHNHDFTCSPKTEITFAGIKDQLFYIFVTGADEGVMAEGFFGITVTEGDALPDRLLSSSSEEGLSSGAKFMVSVGVLMGIGAFAAICAVAYGIYKRRHLSYQEISTSG